jgi:8-oxo-dGTP pyrophosphatase MutT (NUDIX family)
VPIQERAGGHYLTLIERAATLRSHGGEIAFPGGAVTAEDRDTLAAALRECQEEIGIDPENVQIIGQLDQVTVVGSRYLVTPFVGILRAPFMVSPNKQEVNSVIPIPVLVAKLLMRRADSPDSLVRIMTVLQACWSEKSIQEYFIHWQVLSFRDRTKRVIAPAHDSDAKAFFSPGIPDQVKRGHEDAKRTSSSFSRP